MKILFLTNNPITKNLSDWLRDEAHEEVTLFGERLTRTMLNTGGSVFIVSYNYRHIISKDVLDILDGCAVNLHISLLPWNRGSYPNVWSFLDDTPKGVTIHLIDEGVDTGKILLQKEVFFDENIETLISSYKNLHDTIQSLFKENWHNIKYGTLEPITQSCGGSMHTKEDFSKISFILGGEGWNIPIRQLKKRYKDVIRLNGS